MENENIITLSDFQEDYNYLNLFPKDLKISELLLSMGIEKLFFKITVKH